MTSLELRHRLLFAIASASVGCRERGIATVDTEPHDAASTTTITTVDAMLPVTAASSVGNAPPSLPVVPPVASSAPKPNTLCGGAQTHQLCFQPRTSARSQGTGEPAPPPPPSAFNAQGCLPKDMVSDSCCMGPAAGPQFRGGECCYTFCPTTVCCGRPFIVRGCARLAPLRRGSDWTSNVGIDDVTSIDTRARDVLANAWLEDARMEHASAAAFGRFVVQLVALGAPPDLVADAARAASDEVTHATLAFALAARMSGFASCPAPMDLDGAFDARTLDAVIAEVIVEGCIGETVAALVAARQLAWASDARTRAALERIAEDEAQHAELAWRFVRWAITMGGESARAAAKEAFERVHAPIATADDDVATDVLHTHGRLTASEREDAVRSALRDVVTPCACALLEPQYAPMSGGTDGHLLSNVP